MKITGRMAALVAILLVCPDVVPAAEQFQAQVDSVEVLLKARQFGEAVDLSGALADSLVTKGVRGAELARGLELQARSLRRSGKAREPQTLAVAERAVAACAGIPLADADLKAACLNTLGLIRFQRSENAEALPLFREATDLWADARGPNDQKVAAALNNQGLVLTATGENTEARAMLEKAAGIYAMRQDEPVYLTKFGRTTMALAKLHLKLGQYDLARERGERAVEIFRSAPDGQHPRLGSAMGDLAALYRAMGDFERAEILYESALPILESGYGPEHAEVGRLLNNLGNLRADKGDIAAARSCFERALAITEKAEGPDSPQTGVRLLNLASILAELGDLELATACLVRAEDIFQTRLGSDHLYMGFAKQELGSVLAAAGESETGLVRLLAAQNILEMRLGAEHPAVAEVLGDVGAVQMETGRYAAAAESFARGLAIVRAELGAHHPQCAQLLQAQGELALLQGDTAGAELLLLESLAVGSEALGADHPSLVATHLALSRVDILLGKEKSAFDHALEGERIGRDHLILAALAFEERRALQLAGQRKSGLGLATEIALSLDDPEITTRLWAEVVRSRAVVLDLMATRQQRQFRTEESAALSDSLLASTRDLAQLFVRGVGEDSPADHRAALDRARDQREKFERKLVAIDSRGARRLAVGRAGFSQVTQALATDVTLVSFLTYTVEPEGEKAIVALVLRADNTAPQIVPLGAVKPVENAVTAWRWAFMAGAAAEPNQLGKVTESYVQAGRRLAHLIWDPLELDDSAGRICIVPAGLLALVDFQVLPRRGGGFLVENNAALTLVSAERDLLRPTSQNAPGEGLLVMGGMDFGSPSKVAASPLPTDCRRYRDLSFDPLPGTLREVEAVAKMWTELDREPVHRLVGAEASEGAFKAMAGDIRVAHLATHGFFLGGDCAESVAGTRGVGLLHPEPVSEAKVSSATVNPLLLSGLAFSGANNRAAKTEAEDDGILTAYEVAALDLSGLEVAILSACDTGRGEVLDGEGVFGLQRAFALAGTRSLIMSLWPVDDEIAAAWMVHLYRAHLLEGLDYPGAAGQASRAMLLERRAKGLAEHPFTWSPFVGVRTGP